MNIINIAPFASGLTCPRCGSDKIVKNGTFRHRQNFLCKECGKTLSTHTGTAISGIHKRELFMQYAQCLQEGLTIRQAAKQLGISVSTSFAWRHKHLCALHPPKPEIFQEIKSLSVIRTPYSQKGKRNRESNQHRPHSKSVICSDLQGNTSVQTFATARELDRVLRERISGTGTCVLKSNTQLTYAVRRSGTAISAPPVVRKIHITSVSSIETALCQWLCKFRGVATKYLQRYWNWFSGNNDTRGYQWNSLSDKAARAKYLCFAE